MDYRKGRIGGEEEKKEVKRERESFSPSRRKVWWCLWSQEQLLTMAAGVCSWTCDVLTDQGRDGSGWKDEGEEEENEELEVYIINTHIYMKFTRKNRKRKKQESN